MIIAIINALHVCIYAFMEAHYLTHRIIMLQLLTLIKKKTFLHTDYIVEHIFSSCAVKSYYLCRFSCWKASTFIWWKQGNWLTFNVKKSNKAEMRRAEQLQFTLWFWSGSSYWEEVRRRKTDPFPQEMMIK